MIQENEDLLKLESVVRVPLLEDPKTFVEISFEGDSEGKSVLDLLVREHTKPSIWFRVLMGYVRSHNLRAFEIIGEGFNLEEYTTEYESDRDGDEYNAITFICNALIMYYISRGGALPSASDRERYKAKAGTLARAMGDNTSSRAELSLATANAWVYSLDPNQKAFEENLSVITDKYRTHPAALVAKGFLALQQAVTTGGRESCRAALAHFRLALEGSAGVMRAEAATARYGIGLAAHRLGMNDLAAKALKRAAAVAEESGFCHVEALCALAALEFSAGNTERALELVRKAHAAEPRDPVALNFISEYHFCRGDSRESLKAAEEALKEAVDDRVKAESNYLAGRACHSMGNFDQALLYYNNAVSSAPHALAQYGLGQINVHNGMYKNALDDFEKVLVLAPSSFEPLKMAGLLAEVVGNRDLALKRLKAALDICKDDSTVIMHIAQLHAARAAEQPEAVEGFRVAMLYYDRAIETLREQNKRAPAELLNNAAVLKLELGDMAKAEEYLHAAAAALDVPVEEYPPEAVTIAFNTARLYEAMGRMQEAKDIYMGILDKHPTYTDCYIRLGVIARNSGLFGDAVKEFENVLKVRKGDIVATSYLGALELEREDKEGYDKAFERFQQLKSSFPKDPYPNIALGNFSYILSTFRSEDKAAEHLRKATEFFLAALNMDKHNKYAANGVGMCLVEQGNYTDYLNFAKSDTSNILTPEICANAGHIFMLIKDYGKAATSYANAITHYKVRARSCSCICTNSNSDWDNKQVVNAFIYLGMAHFLAKNYSECISALQQALHMQPDSALIWYNMALAQEYAAATALTAANTSGYTEEALKEMSQQVLTGIELTANSVENGITLASKARETYAWLHKMYKAKSFSQARDFSVPIEKIYEMTKIREESMAKSDIVDKLKECLEKLNSNREKVSSKLREEKEEEEANMRRQRTEEVHKMEREEERKNRVLREIKRDQEIFDENFRKPSTHLQEKFTPKRPKDETDSSSESETEEKPRKRLRKNNN